MKLPTILFSFAILSIFAAHFMTEVAYKMNLHEQKENHPEVQAFIQTLSDVVETKGLPNVEKTYTAGYINRVSVNPGFRIIHDPAMGREVIVKGPAAALEVLNLFEKKQRMAPDFTKPVRLVERVEVKLNLHKHGSPQLRIEMNTPPNEQSNLPPDFVTKGPLIIETLFLRNIPDHPIQLAGKEVIIYTRNDTDNLHGTAERLEIQYDSPRVESQKLEAPNLKAKEVILTELSYF